MLKIILHIVAIPFLALGPEEIPEKTEPVEKEGGLLALAGQIRSGEIIGHFDLFPVLAIRHHPVPFDAVGVTVTTVTGARLYGRFGVQLDGLVLDQGSGTVVIAALQEIIIDVRVEVDDHGLGDGIDVSIIPGGGGTVVHHGDASDGAPYPGVDPSHVDLVHRWHSRVSATLS